MPWFAAHAIMYVRFRDGVQTPTPVWENVLLIEGPEDGDLAFEEAEKRAREDEGDSEGSFRWDGRPAEWVFAGIRKLITVSHRGRVDEPRHGDEITYSEFVLPDLAAVEALAAGKTVGLEYSETGYPESREDDAP